MKIFKKKVLLLYIVLCMTMTIVLLFTGASAIENEVYLGGMPVGFNLSMGGAEVVAMCEILTANGAASPAREAKIEIGDLILQIGMIEIQSSADIDKALKGYKAGQLDIKITRNSKEEIKQLTPAKDSTTGKFRLGVLVRDSISGIGTMTYIKKSDLRFGSLGHSVTGENGKLLKVENGKVYNCSIVDVVKGEKGKAGELKGMFMGSEPIAIADKNTATGIFGQIKNIKAFEKTSMMKINTKAKIGKASIYTTIDGITPKEYDISIVKVDAKNSQNKNFVIKIDDPELIEKSGGIVQGMSGSPIVQDGKLIGAVTHVFLNDPTRGYGVAIQNMLYN